MELQRLLHYSTIVRLSLSLSLSLSPVLTYLRIHYDINLGFKKNVIAFRRRSLFYKFLKILSILCSKVLRFLLLFRLLLFVRSLLFLQHL